MRSTQVKKTRPNSRGFTLVELLVAIAIVAILSTIAIPLYTNYSMRSYRVEVQADLLNCSQALERFNAMNFSYAGTADTDADGIGDANAGPIAEEVCDPLSADRYAITIVAPGATYVLTAAGLAGVMADDGDLTMDNVGNRTWDENGDGDNTDAGEDDWNEG
jgi:type IV pilus assembly protein PilE